MFIAQNATHPFFLWSEKHFQTLFLFYLAFFSIKWASALNLILCFVTDSVQIQRMFRFPSSVGRRRGREGAPGTEPPLGGRGKREGKVGNGRAGAPEPRAWLVLLVQLSLPVG